MHVPTVGDVMNTGREGYFTSDDHISATCFCCGVTAPLSRAVQLERSGALFYRCGTCDEPLAMVSPLGAGTDAPAAAPVAWAVYPVATMKFGRA